MKLVKCCKKSNSRRSFAGVPDAQCPGTTRVFGKEIEFSSSFSDLPFLGNDEDEDFFSFLAVLAYFKDAVFKWPVVDVGFDGFSNSGNIFSEEEDSSKAA
ncbi:hypothetical protein CEXT_189281 [Caerostris extrusa]|uniref:Uncharacterized protein n=1 Tax=Caerostris extrusa TaxID=172846 RepID=A0AAV4MI34_CAEEX|nr:hypothetical protein CEXT_189281 [Caerostris extrusa]